MNTELISKAIFSKSPLRILLTGATGFVGQSLVPLLLAQGHSLIILTRSPIKALSKFGNTILAVDDLNLIEKNLPIDLVINLAGAKILGLPWTESRKKTLTNSRVKLTESLVQWMHSRAQKPSLLVSASAIGYYGIQAQDDFTELTEDHPPQSIFMSQLCQDWEVAASEAIRDNISVNILRFGVVLGKGGALPMMLLPIRMGLGGKLGSGKQVLYWIHINDLFFSIPWCIPTSAFSMKLLMGEQSDLLLEGQRVKPTALLESGFQFSYPTIELALRDLLQK
jgi:uncharacterized protein (TIGR01777 family)